ncbi:MAG: OPT/YSL family transporter [Alphaproteobacteria bacterium]|nr:OPT/YSL family transporter [Alphaproteobacteria bacterium]MCB9794449.1 OPT/YSL family transporter [Alphaproteobacteria bacterium]
MALLQPAPKTQAEVDRARPLDISPDEVLEFTEAEWYDKVYRGDDVPQLTLRAVIMGSVLGFLLAFTNLYIGLKTGWALGVAITACILSYAIWNVFLKVGVAKTPMTILETNCMQSAASSAGYATGGTMVSAIAALLMISATPENPQGEHLPWTVLVAWTFCLGVMGTVLAIPMKRNMINQERLKFPSGTAAAVTLQSLYSEGKEAILKAKALLLSALFGVACSVLLDLELKRSVDPSTGEVSREALLPGSSALFDFLPAVGSHVKDGEVVKNAPSDWTIVMDHNPVMIAAGALVGLRVAVWMTLGGLLLAYFVGPMGYEALWDAPSGEAIRATTSPGRAWKEIGLWLGVPIMVSAGLLSFALQWRTILRAFTSLGGGGGAVDERVQRTEVPFSWFAWGGSLAGAGVIAVAWFYFEIPPHLGLLAVGLTFALSLVACRATGESDITPTGAMGKLMQLTYGVLIPQSTTANLMTASITASSAGSAADLLNDLKSGYLLGADPRRQFLAQFSGIFAGTAATVWGFYLLVPDATALNGVNGQAPEFPAPAAQAWAAVAEVFRLGIENMHPMHQQAIAVGLTLGVILVTLETLLPKFKSWLPSATGLSLGLILPFQYPLSMLIGAVIAAIWQRRAPESAESYLVPVSAGVIAGVSIMGVLAAFINNVVLAS